MSVRLAPGQQAPDFELPDVAGGTVHLADELHRHSATVVMFLCNHCPYVKAYFPRLVQLQESFTPSPNDGPATGGVRFIGICSNDATTYPDDSFDNMKAAAKQWGLNFPYLHDEDQAIAHAYGAERTPEIFVLDGQGICRYEGGIDDNYQDPSQVTQQPLRDAIDELTRGRPVTQPQTHAIGCTIKWKNR